MTTFTYSNAFSVAGVGINGATVNAYKASRFSAAPALNVAPPGGSPDATTTTGPSAGFDGAFSIALPTSEDYYISVSYLTVLYWQGPVSQMFEDGTAQGGSAAAGTIDPLAGLPPTGTAGGDLSGTYPSPGVAQINGTSLAGLSTGLLKNTTGTGVPSTVTAPTGTVVGTTDTQTLTNKTLTAPAVTSISGTMTNVTPINNTVTVTSNAGTVPVTSKLSTFTNSSAATMAITIATASATDGQPLIVRVYDFSAVAQTIGWTNTENSTVSVPTTSNGSTTLPLTVGFMFNSATSKWRCVAVA